MKYGAVFGPNAGGKCNEPVWNRDIGFKIVSAAICDEFEEILKFLFVGKIRNKVIVGDWYLINAKDLPEWTICRSGNFDDVVSEIILPIFRQDIGEWAKHWAVDAAMGVEDLIFISEPSIVAIIKKDPAGRAPGAVQGMSEIKIIVGGLHKWIVNIGAGDFNPARSIWIDGNRSGEVGI